MNLTTLLTGKPTYWPSDDEKILDLLDFGIIKDIPKAYCLIPVLIVLKPFSNNY
jgi:hypothetical protein